MIVKFLELENFKSYAGFHRIGPFDQHMSCIVGPNGCGKSNIIDCLLFVFGFKSEKLRQDNLKSLIHRSSSSTANSCRVSIIFNPPLKLSRTVTQSGTSAYYLNDSRTTFSEIQSVLLSHGIDTNTNHFMILQGQIQKLAELTPQQLLSHMEYVFGSLMWASEIEEETSRLAEVRGNRYVMDETVKIRGKYVAGMKKESMRVGEWVEKKIKGLRVQAKIIKAKTEIIRQKTVKCKTKIQDFDNQKQELLQAKCANQQNLISLNKEIIIVFQKTNQCKEQVKSLEHSYQDIKINIASLNTNAQFKQKDFSTAYNKKHQLKDQLTRISGIDICTQGPLVRQSLNELQKSVKDKFSSQQISKFHNIIKKQQQLKSLKYQHQKIQEQISNINLKISNTQKYSQQLNLVNSNHQKTLDIAVEINIHKKNIDKMNISINGLQEILKQIKLSINEVQKCNRKESSGSALVKELMKNTDLKGLKGRLRDYCWIDRKYQKAFNFICPQLDYIIVDKYDNAVAATTYLKQNRLGKSTFIILEQIPNLEQRFKSPFSPPPNSHRLFDLVQCTNHRNVLYWSLLDTLIVESLEEAMPIAYGKVRQRVVTCRGEFIDVTGVMTVGGEVRVEEDGESLKRKAEGLDKQLKDEVIKLDQEKQRMRQKVNLLEAIMEKRKKSEAVNKGKEAKIISKQEIEEMKLTIKNLQSQNNKLQSQMKNISNHLQKLQHSVNLQQFEEYIPKKSELDSLKNRLKTIQSSQATISRLSNRISLQQRKSMTLQTQITTIHSQMKDLLERKSKLSVIIDEKVCYIRTLQLQILQLKDHRKVLQNKCKNNEADQIDDKIGNAKKDLQVFEAELKDSEAQLQKFIRQYESFQKHQIHQIKIIAQKLNISTQAIQLATQQTKNNENYRRKQILQIIDEDEQYEQGSVFLNQYMVQATIFKQKIAAIEKEGPIDLQAISRYEKQNKLFDEDLAKLQAIKQEQNNVIKHIQQLKDKRLKTFNEGFNVVSKQIKTIYQELTRGDIDLSYADLIDPFVSGIELSVRPANKTWKKVNLLSGGEKTMTALALTFAFSQVKHCPFYLMDEIDAALDFKNTGILARYIKKRQKSQMVVISLRKNMYEQAITLTGVFKIRNCTRTLTVRVSDLEKLLRNDGKIQQDQNTRSSIANLS